MAWINPRVSSVALRAALLCALVGTLGACGSLPSLEHRTQSTVVLDTDDTRLGKAIAPMGVAHPGDSGIYPLLDSHEAFAARILLARAADRTLDVQYYIWRPDMSGTLLFEALHEAADRDVRVRLLLDDMNTAELDETLATLDAHPNIEVRLFNPFTFRSPRYLNFLTDFSRLNRRMHNKSFTADNQATIIGGRNVGDEYFGATDGIEFIDLDALAVGPIVTDVSKDFDRYWASASSYPIDGLLPPVDASRLAQLHAEASLLERDPAATEYLRAVKDTSFVRELLEGTLSLEWAPTRMVSDDPAKGLGLDVPELLVPHQIATIVGKTESRFALVSAYFVPGESGVDWLAEMAGRGVEVEVLTNSLEATDVAAVHAGYAKRRKPLLEAGVKLYESRGASTPDRRDRRAGPFGSSSTSLHAKTFSMDYRLLFIGSFNFDPRSAELNTELGFVIESAELARRIDEAFATRIPQNNYTVHLDDNGALYWIERRDGAVVRHDTEPGTTVWQRAWVRFLSWLPIEGLL